MKNQQQASEHKLNSPEKKEKTEQVRTLAICTFVIVAAMSVVVSWYVYQRNGYDFAFAYATIAIGYLLVAAGLLFPPKAAPALAIVGLVVTSIGWAVSPPWKAGPPAEIKASYQVKGYDVVESGSCLREDPPAEGYRCSLLVKPKQAPAATTAPVTPVQ